MARIYISSTYEDLQNERQAAAQAIRRLGHQAITMEDYVAADKRPLDKCLDDVRSCDTYIGIFAWRYGFIPKGYDKSITHLEYEAAKDAKIPCLIFLLDEGAHWPVYLVSTGEERKKIDNLRDELKKLRIISFFKNADELSGLVSAAVSILKFPSQFTVSPFRSKPRLGPLVSKMCNLIPQVNDFMKFFLEISKKCPRRPQFYFIHGDEWQGHESFLERLLNTCLKKFAEDEWGLEYATISPDIYEVPWPKEGKLRDRQDYLQMNVMEKFSGYRETPDLTANTLARLPCFDKRPLVLIKHNIYSSKWDNLTLPLLCWYTREYWAALEGDEHEPIPHFLVFFNVRYQNLVESGFIRKILNRKAFSKEQIKEQLQQFPESASEKCPCLLLKELTPIEREDVSDWFSENCIFEYEWERKKTIDAIFRENDRPVSAISWAKAEIELARVVKEYGN